MKKILLIGNFSRVFQTLNDCLKDDFSVQLCGNNKDQIKDMIRFVRPDMAVVSLDGIEDANAQIFDYFRQAVYKLPILAVGTKEECRPYAGVYEDVSVEFLERPLKKNVLIAKCRELIKCDIVQTGADAQNQEEDETVSTGKKSVLIVDDSALMIRKIKTMLDDKYTVRVATSGKMALNVLEKKKADVILLDYEMPDMDGMMTMEAIRANNETKNIPIIFLTGVSDRQHILAVLKLKPFKYLLKPPVEKDVLDAIEEAITNGNR